MQPALDQNVYDIVVNVLGIEGKVRGDEYDFSCPVHDDRRPSAGVNLVSGLWKCLACGAGGDLVALAAAVRGIDRGAAKKLVNPHTPEALQAALQRQTYVALSKMRRKPKLQLPGPYPPEPLDYMRNRGFTAETLQMYGVGYVKEESLQAKDREFRIRDYIAIPIRDRAHHLLGYIYRATFDGELRYLYTPGLPKASIWFGTHVHDGGQPIVVTEGAIDSMWVSQCGHPAIAALGVDAKAKMSQLSRYRSVTLFMDRDAAGVAAVRNIGQGLVSRVPVMVARYPRGAQAKDPQELDPKEVRRAIRRAVPYVVWSTRGLNT